MKYQVTLQIDETLLEPLIGLMAPYGRIVVKLVEDGKPVETPPIKTAALTTVNRAGRRVSSFLPHKGMGRVITLRLVAKNATIAEMKEAYRQAGISPNGTGANLSKLKQNGYVRRVGDGLWQLTAKGESAVRHLEGFVVKAKTEEAVEHDETNS